MRLAIMQPYFFPYIGYFQLVNTVDKFIFFDDVNFIKKGWINRNRILLNGEAHTFTVPLIKASQNKKIRDTFLADFQAWRVVFLQKIEHAYKKSPNYNETYEFLRKVLFEKNYTNISELAAASIIKTCEYLSVETDFANSSNIEYEKAQVSGQQKIISICEELNASSYINPINGKHLYDKVSFADKTIDIHFIETHDIEYLQFNKSAFVNRLSIIDLLMFSRVDEIRIMLNNYNLT